MRRHILFVFLGAALALSAGCSALSGFDKFQFDDGSVEPELDGSSDGGGELDGDVTEPEAPKIYAHPAGDDEHDGNAPELPVATLQRALDLALTCEPTPCEVHAAAGEYAGYVELASGIHILGGWSDDFTEITGRSEITFPTRSGSASSVIWTVRGVGIVEETRLTNLVVHGADLSALSGGPGTVITLWIEGSPGVVLEEVALHGGHARAGESGAAGQSGASRNGNRCVAAGQGARITNGCQSPQSGAPGSKSSRPLSGDQGGGGGGGYSGCGGVHCDPAGPQGCGNGGGAGPGSPGDPGPHGAAPVAPTFGSWSGSSFERVHGGAGTNGGDGGGGGAGGEGGDRHIRWCTCTHSTAQGGRGGHGGRGGCGGNGGGGGSGGSASFVILLESSTLELGAGVALYGGTGGAGGAGGAGGQGQTGAGGSPGEWGNGDACGAESFSGCRGGSGGDGGNGASGGHGAGGAGGPSVLIARRGTTSIVGTAVESLGTGGQGGARGGGGSPSPNGPAVASHHY